MKNMMIMSDFRKLYITILLFVMLYCDKLVDCNQKLMIFDNYKSILK